MRTSTQNQKKPKYEKHFFVLRDSALILICIHGRSTRTITNLTLISKDGASVAIAKQIWITVSSSSECNATSAPFTVSRRAHFSRLTCFDSLRISFLFSFTLDGALKVSVWILILSIDKWTKIAQNANLEEHSVLINLDFRANRSNFSYPLNKFEFYLAKVLCTTMLLNENIDRSLF